MGHWYKRVTGEPVFEVEKKSGGGKTPTTLAHARKLDLLPSVTTLLDVIAKPGLDKWKINQAVLASLTLPRIEGESDDAFLERVNNDRLEHVRDAAQKGTDIDRQIRNLVMGRPIDPEYSAHVNAFVQCCKEHGIEIDSLTEGTQIAGEFYAGTPDLLSKNGLYLIDIKTQDFKHRAFIADEWPWQLAAYNQIIGAQVCVNIVIDRSEGFYQFHEWSQEQIDDGWEVFKAAAKIWQIQKQYFPGEIK